MLPWYGALIVAFQCTVDVYLSTRTYIYPDSGSVSPTRISVRQGTRPDQSLPWEGPLLLLSGNSEAQLINGGYDR